MANDGSVIIGTEVDDSGFKKGLQGLGDFAGKGLSTLAKGAGVAIAGASTAVVAFGKESIEAGMSFDKAISQVASTMGVTVDEIGDLEKFAKQMGSETAFSATQSAEALNYMALAGYDAETSMKMLPTVLNLASAGGMELANASDMITDASSALGLSLEDTSALVDKMAKASSKSNTSVTQLGDAILTIGGTAKDLAGGTTELSTALGILADNGIKGSEGGTALRNIILALSAPTKEASEKLEELGVSAYDSEGNLRPLNETFDDLGKALGNMTQGDRTQALSKIFNKVDLKSANALLATSQDRWKDLAKAIDNADGSAKKMAETQLDNLAGDITLFKSALEGAELTLSSVLTPALRTFVQFGTKEIVKLDKAFQTGGINGLAKQFGKSLAEAVTTVSEYIPQIIEAGASIAGEFISSVYEYISRNFDRFIRQGGQFLDNFGKGAEQKIPEVMGAIGDLIGKTISNIPKIIEYGTKLLVELGKGILLGIGELAVQVWDGIKGMFSKPVSDDVIEAKGSLADLEKAIKDATGAKEEINGVIDAWADKASKAEPWLEIYDKLNEKAHLTAYEQAQLNTAAEKLNEIYPELGNKIDEETGRWELNTEQIRLNIQAMKDRALADIYMEKAKGLLEQIVEFEIERDKAVKQQKDNEAILEAQKTKYQELVDTQKELDEWIDNVWQGTQSLDDVPPKVEAWAKENNVALDTLTDLRFASEDLQEATAESAKAMESAQQNIGIYKEKAEKAQKAINGLTEDVNAFIKTSNEYSKDAESIGKHIDDGIATGITANARAIAKAGGTAVKGALAEMRSIAQISSPSKLFKNMVGRYIGEGVIVGIKDAMTDDAIADAIGFDGSLFDSIQSATNSEALSNAVLSDHAGIASAGGVAEASVVADAPRYVETTINIDGRETARVLTPYVSKEIAWQSL